MSEIYNVDSLEEALRLAKKFQSEGKYSFFRGQVVQGVKQLQVMLFQHSEMI